MIAISVIYQINIVFGKMDNVKLILILVENLHKMNVQLYLHNFYVNGMVILALTIFINVMILQQKNNVPVFGTLIHKLVDHFLVAHP